MSPDGQEEYILDLLYERGPMSDEDLAVEVIGDQATAADIEHLTTELYEDTLIARSEAASGRWQITDAGRRRRGHEPGR
jgi:hypothetical protein